VAALVEEDVGGLDIEVEHLRPEAVQVGESTQRLTEHAAPYLPRERPRRVAAEELEAAKPFGREHQPVFKVAAGRKWVDEGEATHVGAVAEQREQVGVRAAREDVDLLRQDTNAHIRGEGVQET